MDRVLRSSLFSTLGAAALACALAGCARSPVGPLDLDGRPLDPLAEPALAHVLVFVATDCPISNRYAPELQRLSDDFAGRGVRLWLVYPNSDDTAERVRRHHGEFALRVPAVRDPHHALVARSGITVTPEAAIHGPGGTLLYRGRIDDRTVALGSSRPAPTRHDLAEAVIAVLDGAAPPQPTTKAIGCPLAPLR
jgi:hypothetical protein